ncbi:MAG: hypothetical protein HY819_06480 [Acidobacteria bacterium]|nr:hypothetical protein [Acidobacteriota bacterium]
MRYFVFVLIVLFFSACSKNTTSNQSTKNSTTQPPTNSQLQLQINKETPEEHVPKPPLDGKTAMDVFKHLKSKGWQLNQATAVEIPPFGSEEAVGFNRPDRVGFLIMRYDSLNTAQSTFLKIDDIYRNKFGRAITAKNFTIAVFGGQIRINAPDFKQLSEEEYLKLQQDLVEFCNL